MIPNSLFSFYNEKAQKRGWDHEWNPRGFRPEGTDPRQSSDISAHMPVLRYFGQLVDHITEFGTRGCCSTSAFLLGLSEGDDKDKKLISYDLYTNCTIKHLQYLQHVRDFPKKVNWTFRRDNTLTTEVIDETDLLFVDTLHTYEQVRKELERHGHRVRRYLIFHDTFSQGEKSVDRPEDGGILPAIYEYTSNNNWTLIYSVDFNHGLQIYRKNHCTSR